MGRYLQSMKGKVHLYDKKQPIFEYYNIDVEIERALSNKVYLRSGGSLNIESEPGEGTRIVLEFDSNNLTEKANNELE